MKKVLSTLLEHADLAQKIKLLLKKLLRIQSLLLKKLLLPLQSRLQCRIQL